MTYPVCTEPTQGLCSCQTQRHEPSRLKEPQHPLQPIVLDERGTPRFKANAIIQYLCREVSNLNEISAKFGDGPDYDQVLQLLGYNVHTIPLSKKGHKRVDKVLKDLGYA